MSTALRFLIAAVVCVTAIDLGGCARRGSTAAAGTVSPDSNAVVVKVRNDNPADMDVFVVSELVATRLGTVATGQEALFRLDPSFLPSRDLRIVATPIGGNGRASSGPLVVSRGQTIEFTIAPDLRASSVFIR